MGVRFDKPIPDGVDLGDLCEKGHGFFCNGTSCSVVYCLLVLGSYCLTHCFFCFCFIATDLRFESSGYGDLDKLLVNTLFEVFVSQLQINEFFIGLIFFHVFFIFICFQVVHAESKTCPFILFLKDAEKFVVGNSDSYSALKSRLEYLPENLIVIGSQTHSDNRNEKVVTVQCFCSSCMH